MSFSQASSCRFIACSQTSSRLLLEPDYLPSTQPFTTTHKESSSSSSEDSLTSTVPRQLSRDSLLLLRLANTSLARTLGSFKPFIGVQSQKEDLVQNQFIRDFVKALPLQMLNDSLQKNVASALITYIQLHLPSMVWKCVHGMKETKSSTSSEPFTHLSLRCSFSGVKQLEVSVRLFQNRTSFSTVYQKFYLSGTRKQEKVTYIKPSRNLPYSVRCAAHALMQKMSVSLISSTIAPTTQIMSRKAPEKLKGLEMAMKNGPDLTLLTRSNFASHFPLFPTLLNPSSSTHSLYSMSKADRAFQLAMTGHLFYAADISKGLEVIHRNNLCCLDLTPKNIILRKIGERWTAMISGHETMCPVRTNNIFPSTTPQYTAPEQLRMNAPAVPTMDMWKLGLIFFELTEGEQKNPFLSTVSDISTQNSSESLGIEKSPSFSSSSMSSAFQKSQPCIEPIKQFSDKDFQNQVMLRLIHDHWMDLRTRLLSQLQPNNPLSLLIRQLLNIVPSQRPAASSVTHTIEQILRTR